MLNEYYNRAEDIFHSLLPTRCACRIDAAIAGRARAKFEKKNSHQQKNKADQEELLSGWNFHFGGRKTRQKGSVRQLFRKGGVGSIFEF